MIQNIINHFENVEAVDIKIIRLTCEKTSNECIKSMFILYLKINSFLIVCQVFMKINES